MNGIGERENIESLNDAAKIKILQYKIQTTNLEKAWKRLEATGFKPILIKGWAAARAYPKPFERTFNDVDLIFSPEEFDAAERFVNNDKELYFVDLHKGARHLDSLEFADLFENSIKVPFGDISVRILRPEDHLRILCVHWLNDGGAYKEKLWDIYYAVQNRDAGFDWNRCLDSVEIHRRRWIICTIGLAHRYLGLEIDDLDFADEAKNNIPRWLTYAVEKEWRSEIRLSSLSHNLNDWKSLYRQIKKRIPPNPLQATIEMNGDFDRGFIVYYQLKDVFFRLPSSLKRVSQYLSGKCKSGKYK